MRKFVLTFILLLVAINISCAPSVRQQPAAVPPSPTPNVEQEPPATLGSPAPSMNISIGELTDFEFYEGYSSIPLSENMFRMDTYPYGAYKSNYKEGDVFWVREDISPIALYNGDTLIASFPGYEGAFFHDGVISLFKQMSRPANQRSMSVKGESRILIYPDGTPAATDLWDEIEPTLTAGPLVYARKCFSYNVSARAILEGLKKYFHLTERRNMWLRGFDGESITFDQLEAEWDESTGKILAPFENAEQIMETFAIMPDENGEYPALVYSEQGEIGHNFSRRSDLDVRLLFSRYVTFTCLFDGDRLVFMVEDYEQAA